MIWSYAVRNLLRSTHRLAALGLLGCLLAAAPSTALAVPVLQMYVEGATYDATTDTWSATTTGTGSGGTARIWVVGNVDGDGGKGAISDVTLVVSYDQAETSPAIELTPSTTGDAYGFTDPSTPTGTGTYIQTVSDGSSPTFADGSSLAPHGVFGDGREWQEFALGDFTLTDSPIADIIYDFPPSSLDPNAGQINVYEVSFSGHNGPFHFDVYGTTGEGSNKEHHWAAPFSHDGEAHFTQVPELEGGATAANGLALLIGSAFVIGAPLRKRRK